MSNSVPTAHLVFNLPLAQQQIKRWRGAFVEMAGREYDWLHNHAGSGSRLHYRYPRIQYRVASIDRDRPASAAIFGVGEGERLLRQLIAQPEQEWVLRWNQEKIPLSLADFQLKNHILQASKTHTYRVKSWLALKKSNYQKWQSCNGLVEQLQLLEKLLNNHLIATLRALGWTKEAGFVQAYVQDYRQEKPVRYHEGKFIPFSVTFTANVQIPPLVAMGKGVSHGFGVIYPQSGRGKRH